MMLVNVWNNKEMGKVNGLTVTLNNGATRKFMDKFTLNNWVKSYGCVIK